MNCSAIIRNDSQRVVEADSSTIDTQTFLSEHCGDRPFPTSIHVEIASECNERCVRVIFHMNLSKI